ncbi:MAG TPA: CCA tRNA nucleotidyltransferase [Candidatus Levybacteria bacterium]|nr:CCA tRNA nucleotidyltransferase [Candidatus Levybacteria bacterium]
MKQKIAQKVIDVSKKLTENNYSVHLVGGCVRNMIMNIPVTDWDMATNATPEQIQNVFPDSYYENTYGTVKIPMTDEKKEFIEVTTYRQDSEYFDNRHPSSVIWGNSIEDDLSRRDFTVNAIAMKLSMLNSQISTSLVDPHNGREDIKSKVLKAVGDPNQRFQEDALRLMRAIRFASQLSFTIEDNTWEAIKKYNSLIEKVSWERIRDELLKILACDQPEKGILMLDEAGLLQYILPELLKGKGISQERPGRHHVHDVFTHNILALKHTPATDPIVRLATLIHDVGKPDVATKDDRGLIIFHNHEVKGAQIAKIIAERLKLSKKQKDKIFTLVRWHMFSVDETVTDHAVRKFLRRVGVENVSDMIDLRIGDRLGSGTQTAESWRLKRFKDMIEQELNPPFSINDLAIDGNDIMQELKIKPGRKIGEMLQTLFEEVDQDLKLNTKEYLIKRIHELNT